jgi:hypothetical protein
MLSAAGKNVMLDNWGGDYLSLHETYPGDAGSNETSGGSPAYARKLGTFASATNGSKSLSSSVTFDVAAAKTIRYVGRWSALSGGTFRGCLPVGGNEKEYTVVTGTDVFTSLAHGYADTQKICFINGTAPTGLTEGTVYFVRDATTDTFKVAATSGGAAIDITGQPVAASVVSAITEEVFGSQGTLTVNTFVQTLNG